MITLRAFEAADLDRLTPRAADEAAFTEAGRERLKRYVEAGIAFTFERDGRVLMVTGFLQQWPGVAEIWSVCTKIEKGRRSFVQAARALVDRQYRALELHRLQASTRSDDEASVRWLESMGFRPEGLMRRYGPDARDYLLMARCDQ
jgi:RimJ/RimL family protein N-acetyltransferase